MVVCCPKPLLAQNEQKAQELLVAAAADLAPLERPLAESLARVEGIKVRFVLGASGLLARQIEQGAPYDVFLSANEQFVKELADNGRLIPETVRTYAYGRLGLWSSSGKVRDAQDLLRPGVRHVAIANPKHAPYGVAAVAFLTGRGLWARLEPKVVYGENVRQALQYAESGNADAAITAWTLVYGSGGVLLPDTGHPPIRQAGGVVTGARHEAQARRVIEFLTGPGGRAILSSHGLGVPR